MDGLAQIEARLCECGADYFADFPSGPVNVTLLSENVRPASTLYRFQLNAGQQARAVLVKIPTSREEQELRQGRDDLPRPRRPQLGAPIAAADKYQLEYQALSAIQQSFERLDDPRFRVIRLLDFLPQQRAIVMEFLPSHTLKQLVARASRPYLWRGAPDMRQALYHVGAWLAVYHALPRQEHTQVRQADRPAFVASIGRFARFLGETLGDRPFFDQVARQVIRRAETTLPEQLLLGLAHGDFALRNILIGEGDVVTVLDTLARWVAPIYEDIAYFLVGLKANRLQVFSQGTAFSARQLAGYEHHFLAGYFHEQAAPLETIRLFEVQVLLDKWCSLAVLVQTGRRGQFKTLQMTLINRYCRRLVRQLLADGAA
ncbi:MAG: aminoglycoside phosphotransferase family protein [Chloroflexi bacterium]|nr:aminoglycoside phosphotransferase family protein [Chloroflexota bacterium]MCI0580716.1 aminoglycoside phosphotransferase family protein [Chloroflexota bacterium]MCI0646633.1 aminoglycoside phosphotransferase family protein [Chloroflexota bacterium]MCI0729216.1 aminoglycoside phosphotransferase family protein [Chloroflexota bacterium]